MENNSTPDYDAFVTAVRKLGILDKNNHATLHHSAVSTKDWSELNEVMNQDIANAELTNDKGKGTSN